MVRGDHHRPWDWRFDGISEARKTGYYCVYDGFEYLTLWFGIAVLLDIEGILWFQHVHCSANYSYIGNILPSLVG